jgi:hypothetical protein
MPVFIAKMILMNWESPRALISLRLRNCHVFIGEAERHLTARVGYKIEREPMSKKAKGRLLKAGFLF